jgi:hypothetical protein
LFDNPSGTVRHLFVKDGGFPKDPRRIVEQVSNKIALKSIDAQQIRMKKITTKSVFEKIQNEPECRRVWMFER